ncbi:MAG: HAMP domain-containing sensor histidine kinase [Pseudomonadota bacterium]
MAANPPDLHNAAMSDKPFRLSRSFAVTGLVSILLLSILGALALSRLLTDRMLRQEGVLTMEFIHSLVMVEKAAEYFRHGQTGAPEVAMTFTHVGSMPDVLRASAHSLDRRVIWSSDKSIVGRQFLDNPELERALAGEMVAHDHFGHAHERDKSEHASLGQDVGYFVEIYFPVRDPSGAIVGAVEVYKTPRALFEAIRTGKRTIWVGAALGGLFLYLALFWVVRQADQLIAAQQERLVENETLVAVGEMGSAVAHGIRNPLASIRSSAELALETADPAGAESARDIIAEVDRMEGWVRDLLSYARPVNASGTSVPVTPLLKDQLQSFERDAARRGIHLESEVEDGVGSVRADPLLLGQVLTSLLANAFEALDQKSRRGGRVRLGAARTDRLVRIWVEDDGPGMTTEQLARVFKPFYTTKPKGLGVGLPLAKRIIERLGGGIHITSQPGQGARVELRLPVEG